MHVITLCDHVLNYIKKNNNKHTLADLHIYFLNQVSPGFLPTITNEVTQAVKELIEARSVQLNTDSTLQIVEPDKIHEEFTSLEDLKEAILNYIKTNNGVYFVSEIDARFCDSLRNKNIDASKLQVINTMENITHMENEHQIPVEICKSAPLDEENSVDLSKEVLNYIRENPGTQNLASLYAHFFSLSKNKKDIQNYIGNTLRDLVTKRIVKFNENDRFIIIEEDDKPLEQTNDIYTLTANQNMFLKNILEMIKVYFKNSFGIDLTSEQAFDRMAVLFDVQMAQNPFSIVTPLDASSNYNQNSFLFKPTHNTQPNKSVGETECRIFADTNWNKPQQGVNMNTPFNPQPFRPDAMPFIRPADWPKHVGQAACYTPDMENHPEWPKRNQDVQVDFNSLKAKENSDEGLYAHLYPGFKNMILAQREARNNTEAMKEGLIKAGFLTEPKKKRNYTKKPKK